MALLPRNKIQYVHRGPPLTPINRRKKFQVPKNFREQTPWTVVSWWEYCYREVKREPPLPFKSQLRPAKMLLAKYPFEDVMLAIRKAVGMGKWSPSLWWVKDHPEKLGLDER